MPEPKPFANCDCSSFDEGHLFLPGETRVVLGYIKYAADGKGGVFRGGPLVEQFKQLSADAYPQALLRVRKHAHYLRGLKRIAGDSFQFSVSPPLFDRAVMARRCGELAAKGIYLGTSSWKYAGWLGQIYTKSRYEYRGKVAEKRFEQSCLAEYAETFKTVCVDAAYYTFPQEARLLALAAQVPADFQFGLKVTDSVTIKKFPKLARFGAFAGKVNEQFLNPDLFINGFLKPCEAIRPNIGMIIFEFSKFWKADYAHGRDFVSDLDKFFGKLPAGWPYGVEIRNKHFLHPEYFAMLRSHKAAHVFNAWQDMPTLTEQMAMPGAFTSDELVAARLLLQPGRKYEDAVRMFQPYDMFRDWCPDGVKAGADLVKRAQRQGIKGKAFVFVNNRFEGNAPTTIGQILEKAEG